VRVIQVKLSLSNAYIVLGRRPIVVDTGGPREQGKIVEAMARAGVRPRDVGLILLTHGHSDHAGSARALRQITGAPIAIHAADAHMVRRGRNDPLRSTRWSGRALVPFVDKPFEAFEPDLALTGGESLEPFGIDGDVIHTPGHTAGSITMLAGRESIVGDLLMGGHLGGHLQAKAPRLHYFADDLRAVRASIRVLVALAPGKLHVGHGGPLALEDVVRAFDAKAASASQLHARVG